MRRLYLCAARLLLSSEQSFGNDEAAKRGQATIADHSPGNKYFRGKQISPLQFVVERETVTIQEGEWGLPKHT